MAALRPRRAGVVAAVAVVALGSLAACGGDSSDHDHASSSSNTTVAGATQIDVKGKSFEFTPKEIHVKAGEAATVNFTAEDILHDFTVDSLKFHVSATPEKPGHGGLKVDQPGKYTFYCSVAGHRASGMEGTLIVDPA